MSNMDLPGSRSFMYSVYQAWECTPAWVCTMGYQPLCVLTVGLEL